ncbi:hypothetical protein F7D13_01955 [Methylocystis rosea]|uniref:Uncharacterized protein n=1 Tax=Methylocystis rosea TaxID=173366 RepID=A0ABX6EDA2_9HYPH|nr:DUF6101 family protein [Methylocystis rosea]QGM92878.1 hypothetical protein F7D13_01955 [Methylocystis rosea]
MVEANTARRIDERVFFQRDRRADGGARRIRVTRDDVLISRRYSGVSMVITVPVTAYCGVALEVQPADDGSPRYVLSLAHRDPDLDILLGDTQDCGAAASDWRHWAAWLGLPRVTEEDGALRSLEGAGEAIAAASPRRRCETSLGKRRPRFLFRRKAGDSRRTKVVHGDEREIISYE